MRLLRQSGRLKKKSFKCGTEIWCRILFCYNQFMAKSKIFLILSLSFIFGIFIRSFSNTNPFIICVLLIFSIIAASLFYKNKIILVSGCAILFFVFGLWLTDKKLSVIDNLENNLNYSGKAVIIKEPTESEFGQKIIAEIELRSPTSKPVKILINANKYADYNYGDELNISCNLALPENKDFDYRMYLAKDSVFYLCDKAQVEKTGSNRGNNFFAGILKIKNKFNGNINQLIPFPESGLMSGLILGGSSGLPKELQNNFSRTGMTHIVAVSGYNVTIVAEYLMMLGIFLGLWRPKAFWFAVFGILIFVLMTGLTASAVRAGVMGTLLLWAMKNGRLANSQNAIVFAAAVMLLFNPLLLRWDIGFQLSFLATLGIIYLYPYFENKLSKSGKLYWLWEILFLSLSAQIFVLPIILYNFQNLSLISLVANVLILPIVPATMLLGFLMAALNFILTPLATIFAWLSFVLLKYETIVINFLGSLKYAAVGIENFPWWGVALWYLLLIVSVLYFKKRRKNRPDIDVDTEFLLKPRGYSVFKDIVDE